MSRRLRSCWPGMPAISARILSRESPAVSSPDADSATARASSARFASTSMREGSPSRCRSRSRIAVWMPSQSMLASGVRIESVVDAGIEAAHPRAEIGHSGRLLHRDTRLSGRHRRILLVRPVLESVVPHATKKAGEEVGPAPRARLRHRLREVVGATLHQLGRSRGINVGEALARKLAEKRLACGLLRESRVLAHLVLQLSGADRGLALRRFLLLLCLAAKQTAGQLGADAGCRP